MCRCHISSGIFMLLSYVSPHVICIPQRLAEIVVFCAKYIVLLCDILPKNHLSHR
jgi:hypothetical protein